MENQLVKAIILLLPISISGINVKRCPEKSNGLLKWSDSSIWTNGQLPEENADVIIDIPVLLDIEPPQLYSITIKPEGYLIWDTSAKNIKVHWINVEGEMHIGGEECRLNSNQRITFIGDIADIDTVGKDKGLYVQEGGTLEIHGEEKLAWTKLARTAFKPTVQDGSAVVEQLVGELIFLNTHSFEWHYMTGAVGGAGHVYPSGAPDVTPGFFVGVHINTADVPWDEKALLVYHISATTGHLLSEDFFVFTTTENRANANIQDFKNFVDLIPDGDIVAFAVLGKIDKTKRLNLSEFENYVAQLGYADPNAPTPVRGVKSPGAYAFVTKKGDITSTVEIYQEDESVNDATAVNVYGDVHVLIRSHAENKKERNYVKLVVSKGINNLHPKLSLLDDVTSWNVGDEIVIASTDFDWKQAEVRQIIKCDDCSSNEVRINDFLSYTHYGGIYKGVDMRAEVGLLTRNIKFDSEAASDGDNYGGHLRFLQGFKSVRIEGAEFTHLGSPIVLGRYPLHFHMCHDVQGRQFLRQNSIHHSFTRGITIHGTHNALVEKNVVYLTKGHSYFLEDGGERGTIFDGNLGLGTQFGSIILSDEEEPTTFWITNPNTWLRNNVAAGSDGTGFWFVYPDEPLGLSAGLGFMLPLEARYTAVPEFYGNTAHSNGKFGLNMDFRLHEDETTTGYNKWTGKEDPVMHVLYSNSTDRETTIEKFTGYKNRERHTWIRCGLLRKTKCGFANSLIGTSIIRMTTYIEPFIENSIVLGLTDNIGEPDIYEGAYKERSYPDPSKPDHPQIGYEILKRPVPVNGIWFDGFVTGKEYDMGAIGFRISSKLRTSPRHRLENIMFGFDDPQEGNRVINYPPGHPYYTNEDGDDNESFIDFDGSVTGYPGVTVVLPVPFHLTTACTYRDNWKMAFCDHTYGTIRVNYGNAGDIDSIETDENVETSENELTMARDDDHIQAYQTHDIGTQAPFLVILNGSHSYSMHFTQKWPDQEIKLFGLGITRSEFVRAGICIPRGATFTLTRNYPVLESTSDWTSVNSFSELDTDTVGDKYLYDPAVGYLAIMFRHTIDREEGSFDECPQDKCLEVRLKLDLSSADINDVDCFPRLYNKYSLNELTPQNGPSVPVAEYVEDLRTLIHNSRNPPPTWGALPDKK